ncbi:hypothetical protein YO5_04232 [Stutzerimonas stutzeri TS44]|nr:hypothetical protein YO5_04232 [Stutzerimonas stutzeri TS44]
MIWRRTSGHSSRELLRAEHRPWVVRPRRLPWLALLLLAVIAGLLWWRHVDGSAHAQHVAQLAAANQALQATLAQGRLQTQEIQATNAQLLRRNAQLSARIEQLQTELAFFRQQKKKVH